MLKCTKIYGLNLRSDHTQIWYKNRVKITLELSHKVHLWFLLLKEPTIRGWQNLPKCMLEILILV